LDGGMPAWVAAGQQTTTDYTAPAPGSLTPHPHPELVATSDWVNSHLHQPNTTIIDAREADAYSNTDTGANASRYVHGHIPGAANLPSEVFVTETFTLKDKSALADLLTKAGAKPGNQVVTYCWVGQRGTLPWFTAKLLGYDAKLYDGSWQDW